MRALPRHPALLAAIAAIAACKEESKVPEGAAGYAITVTAVADQCHPDSEQGYTESFDYFIALDASTATIYIDEQVFAIGIASGCTLSYQTPIIGEDTDNDGNVKWQLFGEASLDAGDDACVPGENDWEGTEAFEIVSSEDDTLEPGCEYRTETTGKLIATE